MPAPASRNAHPSSELKVTWTKGDGEAREVREENNAKQKQDKRLSKLRVFLRVLRVLRGWHFIIDDGFSSLAGVAWRREDSE